MLTLFHAPYSRSGRILWLMEELGAPFDIRQVEIMRGDGSGRRDPSNVHPDGKVPAVTNGDVIVTESLAIALYLTDLLPEAGLNIPVGHPERGAYLTMLCWLTGEFEPICMARMYGSPLDARQQAAFDAAVSRVFQALEPGPYLMGEQFTTVDVMLGSALLWARSYLPASAELDLYLDRLTSRPAHQRSTARDSAATS